ncbi:MAG: DUF3710 domain-containing protein [Actinobacteria bacterium]|nr:DUF3710 domain-containing protein [Actinomycetota bacterium]
MFRRRRYQDADQPAAETGRSGPEADEEQPGHGGQAASAPAEPAEPAGAGGQPAGGPWDAGDDVPPAERVDLGSLQVPVGADYEVQVSMTEDQAAWVTVVRDESALQLQAFAAPKSGGLWDDVRQEITAEVRHSGGQAQEAVGRFGPELLARIAAGHPGDALAGAELQPVRFLGVDGPRWFLRGVISGAAAQRPELAGPLEDVFAGVVVVRGEHPAPPRDLLEIRLPEDARQALAEQMEQAGGRFQLPDPFERGPEITETR